MVKIDTQKLKEFTDDLRSQNESIFKRIASCPEITDFDVILNTVSGENALQLNLYGSVCELVQNTYTRPLKSKIPISYFINYDDIKEELHSVPDFPKRTNISLRFFKSNTGVETHRHPLNPKIFCHAVEGVDGIFKHIESTTYVNIGDEFSFDGIDPHSYVSNNPSVLLLIALKNE